MPAAYCREAADRKYQEVRAEPAISMNGRPTGKEGYSRLVRQSSDAGIQYKSNLKK